MATLKSRWLEWQPPTTTAEVTPDDRSPEPNMPRGATDKTDKSPSVSFVSAVTRHITAEGDQGAGTSADDRQRHDPGTDFPASGKVRLGDPPKLDRRDGIPDEWHQGVLALIKCPCPAGVTPVRWRRLKLDAAKFYEQWAAQASALGWSTYDVFGVNERAPFERVDMAALVRLLNGRPIIAMTADEAIIECSTGARQTFRSKGPERGSGQTLLWELGDETNDTPEAAL